MGLKRNANKVLVTIPEEKSCLEDLGIERRSILKSISRRLFGKMWTAMIWFRVDQR
jgi:hypothetical protein